VVGRSGTLALWTYGPSEPLVARRLVALALAIVNFVKKFGELICGELSILMSFKLSGLLSCKWWNVQQRRLRMGENCKIVVEVMIFAKACNEGGG
jgi:hypothetical protein